MQANVKGWALLGLAYSATGVIFGDIATSPLYVFPSVFYQPPSREDSMGALCLIFWTLSSIGLLKYVSIVLYANDAGEGRHGLFSAVSVARIASSCAWSRVQGFICPRLVMGRALQAGLPLSARSTCARSQQSMPRTHQPGHLSSGTLCRRHHLLVQPSVPGAARRLLVPHTRLGRPHAEQGVHAEALAGQGVPQALLCLRS